MARTADVGMLIKLFEKLFEHYERLDSEEHAKGAVVIH
jgi:hypothetical protein